MSNAKAADITVLSAGAVEPGLTQVIAAFRRETGRGVKIDFATAPTILKRIGGGETADVLIAPPAVLDDLVKAGKAAPAKRVTRPDWNRRSGSLGTRRPRSPPSRI